MNKINTTGNKFSFVTGLHGNEVVPILALASQSVPQIIGNPQALAARQRFIDTDLNKSFGVKKKTHETNRAKEILKLIPKTSYVLDFHTTSCKTPPFAIIVDLKLLPIAQTLGLKHIVFMKHNIKKNHALINHQRGVSIETGTHDTKEAFETTLSIISSAKKNQKKPATLYEVFDIITKPGRYKNFSLHPDGFYPILAGEVAYDFFGLKAKKIRVLY